MLANVLKRATLWAVLQLKLGMQALLPKRQADIFLGCAGEWRYPSYLLRALRSTGPITLEVPANGLAFILRNSSLQEFLWRVLILPDNATPTATIIISRDTDSLLCPAPFRSRVCVDYFAERYPINSLVMPYFIHPELWRYEKQFARFSNGARPIRIGFAGTINTKSYAESFDFPMMNRAEVFDTLFARFGDHIELIRSREVYSKIKMNPRPILIVATDSPATSTRKHILNARKYLSFLGRCSFFIAPPGFEMPFSHNLLEAMFLGAIPILNYATYLVPPLRDGVDCLMFSTPQELCQVIDRVLTMSPVEIGQLRSGVNRYVNDYLSATAFGRQLHAKLETSPTIVVNEEIHTVKIWKDRQAVSQ